MGFYQFKREQVIPAEIDKVWEFISNPHNLKTITPEYMGFDIVTDDIPKKMHKGMIIGYKVSPLFGIKTTWVTEITQVEENKFFIDEQRIGPYKLWHHQHHIQSVKDGVLMTDIVSYAPPFGILGSIANQIIIKKKLNEIFDFRTKVVSRLFEKNP